MPTTSSKSPSSIGSKPSIFRKQVHFVTPPGTNYFRDGKRRIDFVLVCSSEAVYSQDQQTYMRTFISNLESKGLHFEFDVGRIYTDLFFIKVHGPKSLLESYAEAMKISLALNAIDYQLKSPVHWNFMVTELTRPTPGSDLYLRAKKTLLGMRPTRITPNERTMVLQQLFAWTYFGDRPYEYGLSKLLDRKIFKAAYTLHEGPWKWSLDGPLNDRQLLASYWANINLWYKEQPLEVVEKYFGPEVAFYFAFCGFYNKMLLVASSVGVSCFIYSLFAALVLDMYPIHEICESNMQICPEYFKYTTWKYSKLSESCFYAKLNYVFDNRSTIFFGFFMSFWATVFCELWKRHCAVLFLRWNLVSDDIGGEAIRREYEENTPYRRVCPISQTLEAYVPKTKQICHYALTFITCLFMITIVLFAVFGTIIYRLTVTAAIKMSNRSKLKKNVTLITMTTGSYISVLFITLFSQFYNRISLWLTIKENPRTQAEFNDSYLYKKFLLSFVNNYAALTYIAFVKGKLYTYPGDNEQMMVSAGIRADMCHISGCVAGLCIQLAFIMLFKSLVSNIVTALQPTFKKALGKWFQGVSEVQDPLRQWEADYCLQEAGPYFLIGEYTEMVIQFGLVTFFAAAFPLAPLCAFINNMIELRTDAMKYIKHYRKPIPVQIHDLNAWNGILQAMALISTVTNAFVIAFTSDFVKREIYVYNVDSSLKGYINSTLSAFNANDAKTNKASVSGTCYYRGNRNPPDHPNKYELSANYWTELVIRFIVAAIFEHAMLTLTGILAYAIPDIPHSVKKRLKLHNKKLQEQEILNLISSRGTNVFGEK